MIRGAPRRAVENIGRHLKSGALGWCHSRARFCRNQRQYYHVNTPPHFCQRLGLTDDVLLVGTGSSETCNGGKADREGEDECFGCGVGVFDRGFLRSPGVTLIRGCSVTSSGIVSDVLAGTY